MKAGSSLSDAVRTYSRPAFCRDVGNLDVEVVEHLQVVCDEADRTHDHGVGATAGTQSSHDVADVGAEPRLGGASRALPGHVPFVQAGLPRDELR